MKYCDRVDSEGFICDQPIPANRQHHWCKDCHNDYMVEYRKKNGNKNFRQGRKGPVFIREPK